MHVTPGEPHPYQLGSLGRAKVEVYDESLRRSVPVSLDSFLLVVSTAVPKAGAVLPTAEKLTVHVARSPAPWQRAGRRDALTTS
jgi:hypothetical protein